MDAERDGPHGADAPAEVRVTTDTPGASVPAVTVLMTAFNRERYIAQAIESVLAQTFGDFELVIVDDASTDGTVRIAREYAAADRRVRVEVNAQNLGDYPNRNRAAALARGELFKYHDSDDVMYPHCLQLMVDALRAEPSADFALTGSRAWSGGPTPMLLTPEMSYAREYIGHGMFHGGPACAMFRRAWFERVGGFELHGPPSDYFFWSRVCRSARVVLVSTDLFWWRVHEGQRTQTPESAQDMLDIERAGWAALFHPDCPLHGATLEQARRNRLTSVARRATRDAMSGNWRMALSRVRAVNAPLRLWVRYLGTRRLEAAAGTPQWHQS